MSLTERKNERGHFVKYLCTVVQVCTEIFTWSEALSLLSTATDSKSSLYLPVILPKNVTVECECFVTVIVSTHNKFVRFLSINENNYLFN